jgi:hypothetical protein
VGLPQSLLCESVGRSSDIPRTTKPGFDQPAA